MGVVHIAMTHGDPMNIFGMEVKWSNNASLYRLSVARNPGHYEFLNDVAFGHKELWQTLVADSLSVTSQMLWHLTTTNYGGLWPWIASLWTLKCCCLGHNELWWPKSTNCLSVNSQMLVSMAHNELWWPKATNCLSVNSQILLSLATQWTVAMPGRS